jgi:hypothetical protein
MKKLRSLKAIVDFIWIVFCIPLIPLMLIVLIMAFFDTESLLVLDKFHVNTSLDSDGFIWLNIVVVYSIVIACIYCFFVFRRTLRYFLQAKPFHEKVIFNFLRVGRILLWVGIAGVCFSLLIPLLFSSKLNIGAGLWSYLFLSSLGLFFQVLSEVFKIARHAKEENQLTI